MKPSQRLIRSAPNHRHIDLEIHRMNGKPVASSIVNGFVLFLAAMALIALCYATFSLGFTLDQMKGINNV